MTHPLGPGEYHVVGFTDDVDEVKFRCRERFLDLLREEAPNAYADYHERVKASVHTVFNAKGDQATLTVLVEEAGFTWDWPPSDDSEWPPYGEGFLGASPTPPGTFKMPLNDIVRIFRRPDRCWRFHGWLLRTLLREDLDSWSERWNLGENPWVASHLLARICKAHLFSEDDNGLGDETKLDHRIFPSLGVLACFLDSLGDSFDTFREWDPTQELRRDWEHAARERFENAVKHYCAAVEAKAEVPGLKKTPDKRKVERDLRRLVRFQVLHETLESLRKSGEHERTTQRAVEGAADLVGLRRRTV